MPIAHEIRLVAFDWAGTTIDFGCLAPTGAFVAAFAARGVAVTLPEARGPMGLHKKEHIRQMLRTPSVAKKWAAAHDRSWTEADVESLYATVTPAQVAAIEPHGEPVPGALDAAAALRARGVKIAGTTGYFREAAERCYAVTARHGFRTDFNCCADDVPTGRPAPWMLFAVMQALSVYPPSAVVKIGDTVSDIEEGRNAGAWSIGVTDTGNEMGLTRTDFEALSTGERDRRRREVREKLLAAGAHEVVASVADVPEIVDRLNRGHRLNKTI